MRARRLAIVDEYREGGRVAVYSEADMVVLLSELASMAWSVLGEEWTDADDVTAELVEVFGDPGAAGDALAMTQAALRTLAEHGIVELDADA
ncbi:hypothetical protein [Nocardioides cynanchi]|uniref:hypothetical protein n=1 Tax=Nocardioides cynanchi TaxID=2558918 RepID=UPI0012452F73|nr:hypothetical protein [Nocardioides cynanchi]